MKSLIPLLLIPLLFACSSPLPIDDRGKFGLTGNVQSFSEQRHGVKRFPSENTWDIDQLTLYGHQKVEFDEEGRQLGMEMRDRNNQVTSKMEMRYENGKLTEQLFYTPEGTLTGNAKYLELTPEKVRWESYDSEGNVYNKGTSYFENGQMVKQEFTAYTSPTSARILTTVFSYDEDGQLILQKQEDSTGEFRSVSRFEYVEYDDQGNWTKRLNYDSETSTMPAAVTIRTITYY